MNMLTMSDSLSQKTTPTENCKLERFTDWLLEGKASFPKIALQECEKDYRALFSEENIREGETIIRIPLTHIITEGTVENSPICREILMSPGLNITRHSQFAIFLLYERLKKNSFWQPYLKVLPRNFNTVPLFFNQTDLKELTGSYALDKLKKRKDYIAKQYNEIALHYPDFKQFSLTDFAWAHTVVITRIYGFTLNCVKTVGLVPFADMGNHRHEDKQTRWFFCSEDNTFRVNAIRNIQHGDEVTHTYGEKCNSRFLVNYGFTLANNPNNQAAVSTFPEKSPSTQEKFFLSKKFDHELEKAMSIFRKKQALHIKNLSSISDTYSHHFPINVENEIGSLNYLIDSCKHSLMAFPTTLSKDREILRIKSGQLNINLANALRMRSGEKEVLHFIIESAKNCRKLLYLSSPKRVEASFKHFPKSHTWHEYVHQNLIHL